MRRWITASVIAALAAFAFAAPALAAPANDNFADAKQLSPLPFTDDIDLAGAGTEPGEPQVCNFQAQSVWYTLTPSSTKALRANLNGSDFGVVFNVYRSFSPGLGGLGFMTCIGFGGSANITAEPGTTYYIQAGSVSPGPAHLRLTVESLPPPGNDDFASARDVGALPYVDDVDTTLATVEQGEPVFPTGAFTPIVASVWYRFTPTEEASYTFGANGPATPIITAYTGTLGALTEAASGASFGRLTFKAKAGTTYAVQVGRGLLFGGGGTFTIRVEKTPAPAVSFFWNPFDPSIFDDVSFNASVFDPVQAGISTLEWEFGDGTVADGCCVAHRFAADGDYSVKLTATTTDGRTGTSTRIVSVKTHDLAITRVDAPNTARVDQTRDVTVGISNQRYTETAQVTFYKAEPGTFERYLPVGSSTIVVPAHPNRRTLNLSFSYTFTEADAAVGKVTFKVVAGLVGARDATPADNTIISLPTTVKP